MLDKIEHGDVLELRINRPPANALNLAVLNALIDGIQQGERDAGAIVLSGRPGMFSAGLDVPALLKLDKAETRVFLASLFKLMETVARCRVPIACAMTGHSPAGGTVIAIFADYRVMCRGKYRAGLNEVQVGLAVPETIQRAMMRLTGPQKGAQLMMAGQLLLAEEACQVGLVDALADSPEAVVEDAVQWCQALLRLPPKAMLDTRKIARQDLGELFDAMGERDIDRFVSGWFEEETQQAMHALVARLGK